MHSLADFDVQHHPSHPEFHVPDLPPPSDACGAASSAASASVSEHYFPLRHQHSSPSPHEEHTRPRSGPRDFPFHPSRLHPFQDRPFYAFSSSTLQLYRHRRRLHHRRRPPKNLPPEACAKDPPRRTHLWHRNCPLHPTRGSMPPPSSSYMTLETPDSVPKILSSRCRCDDAFRRNPTWRSDAPAGLDPFLTAWSDAPSSFP
mmetsp:Transcript_35305/g.74570  ORF Transcript_35305/g.74570 Transcript_35305/m.74570 type:complete len:202 (+) Transcript_35305:182-787(+)